MARKLTSGEQWLRDETTNEIVGIKDSVDGQERFVPFISADASGNLMGLVDPNNGVVTLQSVLAQSAVPVIVVPNGTVATNGTITLGTALPTIYSGGAWIYLPADAIVGGLAGLYWCVFSSTTVGVVKTNFDSAASQFIPRIPSGVLVTATGSNVAYTQATGSALTLANVTVSAGSIGLNGAIRTFSAFESNNTIGNKILGIALGATSIDTITMTTAQHATPIHTIRNRGVANQQVCTRDSALVLYKAVDTSVAVSLIFSGQLATATDYIILEAFTAEVARV